METEADPNWARDLFQSPLANRSSRQIELPECMQMDEYRQLKDQFHCRQVASAVSIICEGDDRSLEKIVVKAVL